MDRIFIICVILLIIGCTIIFNKPEFKTQKTCPVTNNKTMYSSCIQDPRLNNGFIISVGSIKYISDIQRSLNINDKKYTIKNEGDKYVLSNNDKGYKQTIYICEPNRLKEIMNKVKTKSIYSSV